MLINYLRKSDCISETTGNTLKKLVLPLGLIAFAVSLLLKHFAGGSPAIDFTSGFLMGLSIVLNVAGIIILKRWKNK